jgi:16S rRNA (uracil1498-N3)-methyltransferase
MALRRFYLAPEMVNRALPEITGSDAGHISRVLRLSTDDVVELFDGTGKGYRARIVSASPKKVIFTIESSFALLSESPVHITLAQGMLKDRKMDDLIRQLTELGVDSWMPFYACRSVPSPGKKGWVKRLERWEKIAVEAVKQCRRGRVPEILPMDDFKAILAAAGAYDKKIIFWEDINQAFEIPKAAVEKILLVVGPEGGFDPSEVQKAKSYGFLTAGLGPRILRAETAALAACTLVQYWVGDMGANLPATDSSTGQSAPDGGPAER